MSTIIRPIRDRYVMISNVSKSNDSSRPATAIAEKEKIAPDIQRAARMVLDMDCSKRLTRIFYDISANRKANNPFLAVIVFDGHGGKGARTRVFVFLESFYSNNRRHLCRKV